MGGVVVHHQVQLPLGIGAGHMLEEGEELLVSVPVLAQPGHLPSGVFAAWQCAQQLRQV